MSRLDTLNSMGELLRKQRSALNVALDRLGEDTRGSTVHTNVDEADRLADLLQRRLEDLFLSEGKHIG